MPDAKAALEGARDILVERFAETADLLAETADSPMGSGCRDVHGGERARKRLRKKSSAITMPILKPSARSRRIARWRCFAAAPSGC